VTLATTDAYQKILLERLKVRSEFMVSLNTAKTDSTPDTAFSFPEIPLPATPSKQVIIAEPKESELK
jgi:hypothetical protein